jgi:hypothetical protein
MTTHLQRSFFTLLVLLLMLITLTAPGAQVAPPPSGPPQTAQDTMPEGVMSALLEAYFPPSEREETK